MRLAVDIELDGDLATFLWPVEPVVLDEAGVATLIRELEIVRDALRRAAPGMAA